MATYDERLCRIEKENSLLKQLVKELIAGMPPPPSKFVPERVQKLDPLRNAMPNSAVDAMAAVVDTDLIQQIVADNRRRTNSASMLPPQETPAPQVPRGTGYAEAKPLRTPAGVAALDRIMDEQDRLDREDLLERSVKRAQLSKPMPAPKPKQLDAAALDEIMRDKPAGGG